LVKLRLKRYGRSKRPFYRLCAIDQRSARDSRAIEELGFYDPVEKDEQKAISFNAERARYWLDVGAQPSRTVKSLLKKAGVDPTVGKAKTVGG
jgi:small subunit ribosomal protein S16